MPNRNRITRARLRRKRLERQETKTMPRYRIMNRITRAWWEGEANSAQEACQKAGWPIGDCWGRQYSPKGCGIMAVFTGGWKNPDDAPELGRGVKEHA